MQIPWDEIDPLVERALAEDIGWGDATSEAVIPADMAATANIVAKADGVVAGLPIVERVFRKLDPGLEWQAVVADGTRVSRGQILVRLRGRARALLAGERTALNFLQRLSGIATLTATFAEAVADLPVVLLDTRKTLPGWRWLDKYAVRMGGGHNHRHGLWDAILIKENHVRLAGSISEAVRRARRNAPASLPIIVEASSLDDVQEALAAGVDRLLLDNMDLESLRRAVAAARGRAQTEASGGVSLATVRAIAETGVDFISIGQLTHSAPALDIAMYTEEPEGS